MDIEFGELEHTQPVVQLRPDRNKHYAVVACGSPDENELAIFVDVDVMRDMEAHALDDTSVELGGVLLGGQYTDEEGRPFVLVTDSLRAEHYESTKGSFKFTHETWEKITRERELFPAELQMVGWYHTHPDWGVFLSHMDMFICDHFFNKPLDVALVIDPCRGDRGWFQWTGDPNERVRRTGGFYLTASRFRANELQRYTQILEGKLDMARETRFPIGDAPYPAPIINVGDRGGSWQSLAVMGMLTAQFLLLGLLAWKLLTPQPVMMTGAQREADRLAAQQAILNEVIGKLDVVPDGLVDELTETRARAEELSTDKLAQQAYLRELQQQTAELGSERDDLVSDRDRWRTAHEQLESKLDDQKLRIAALTKELRALQGIDDETLSDATDEAKSTGGLSRTWWIVISVAAAVVLAGALAAISVRADREKRHDGDEQPIDPSAFEADNDT
ncbi:MAG: Mov34/MPN/PAD-1 family protein [Planctomycetales bacterium]|nr:Mov34/MPN/PAD-1 family protein [Planctomycetales bacterium]